MNISERITAAISKLEFKKLNLGYRVVNFLKAENIPDEQTAYRQNLAGLSTISDLEGAWKPGWLVIATDELGCPIFVDQEKDGLPVYTASKEEDSWEIYYVANSFENYIRFMQILHKVSEGRETPEDFKVNPVPEAISDAIMVEIEKKSPDIDLWYWELFLENI